MLTTIVIADDHELVRSSFAALLSDEPDFRVVAECADGRALLEEVARLRPDVAVVDVAMPELNGIEAIPRLKLLSPQTRVIVISNYSDEAYVRGALEAGAVGYIIKSGAVRDLISAVRDGSPGKVYLSGEARAALGGPTSPGAERPLSPREREVLQLIAEGHTSKEIAERLGIGETTVKTHRNHIMEKLNVQETAGMTRHAIRLGLVRAE